MAKCLYIELGMTQIRVAVAVQNKKSTKVTETFWIPAPQGAVEDGVIRDTKSVGERIKEVLVERDLAKVNKAVFTVFSSRIATRTVSVPFVKVKQIQVMVETNATDYFPIDMTQYSVSYQILGTEEKEGVKNYRLMVYATPKLLTTSFMEVAAAAGLIIDKIDYMGNSVYQAFREERQSGVHMIMKVEENSTLITVIQDGELELQRSLNYGIDQAIEAVQNSPVFGTDLGYLDAYDILKERQCIKGNQEDVNTLSEEKENLEEQPIVEESPEMQAAVQEVTDSLHYLSGNILRIVDYYISRHADREFESIAIAGMGAECKGLQEWLGSEIGMEVAVAAPENNCGFTKEMSDDGSTSGYYLAVLGSMINPVNLAESAKRTEKKKVGSKPQQEQTLKGAFVVLGVAVCASLVLVAVAGGIRGYEYFTKKSLESKIEKLKPMEDLYNQYLDAKNQYSSFISMYEITETPNEQLVSFFEELEAKMPTSINISTFSSTGTGIDMALSVGSKADATQVLMQLRKFESLTNVYSPGLSVTEGGTIEMNVTANYAEPATEGTEMIDTEEVTE